MQIASNLIKVLSLIVLVLLVSCVKEMPQSPSNVNGGEEIISGGGATPLMKILKETSIVRMKLIPHLEKGGIYCILLQVC